MYSTMLSFLFVFRQPTQSLWDSSHPPYSRTYCAVMFPVMQMTKSHNIYSAYSTRYVRGGTNGANEKQFPLGMFGVAQMEQMRSDCYLYKNSDLNRENKRRRENELTASFLLGFGDLLSTTVDYSLCPRSVRVAVRSVTLMMLLAGAKNRLCPLLVALSQSWRQFSPSG